MEGRQYRWRLPGELYEERVIHWQCANLASCQERDSVVLTADSNSFISHIIRFIKEIQFPKRSAPSLEIVHTFIVSLSFCGFLCLILTVCNIPVAEKSRL